MSSVRSSDPVPALQAIAQSLRTGYRTLEELVIEAVRRAILDGVFEAGAKLPQDQIAVALGVSRIPVRSALRSLESEGLVVFHPHRGATVSSLTPEEVAEIYEIRTRLEAFALQAACERIKPEEVGELEELARQVDQAHDSDDAEAFLEARKAFYHRLYEIAQVPRTAAIIERLRAETGRYLNRKKTIDEHGHTLIVEAIKKGDPVSAEKWLQEHLAKVSKDIQETVRTLNPESED